eukprot:scaffold211119_cov30-Tisochrysis_lutea.AAC.3
MSQEGRSRWELGMGSNTGGSCKSWANCMPRDEWKARSISSTSIFFTRGRKNACSASASAKLQRLGFRSGGWIVIFGQPSC